MAEYLISKMLARSVAGYLTNSKNSHYMHIKEEYGSYTAG